jgi:hypothetical protein
MGSDVVSLVDALASALWQEIDALAELVERAFAAEQTRRADLPIEDRCTRLIERSGGRVAGAGFVAAPGSLADTEYWLEWWLGDADGDHRRLQAELDPHAIGFRDYTELPWYAVPALTGERHVTGPYVDYVCTDQHTLTFTRPVRRRSAFVGVVGADVLATRLDTELAAALSDPPVPTVLINRTGRVVVASEPDWVVGDLVRGLPLEQWFAGEPADHPRWRFAACSAVPLGSLTERT